MNSVDYSFWGKYLKEIHDTLGEKTDNALELASGNCSLANHLKDQFNSLILSDISFSMLKNNKTNLNSVCCDMLHLPFTKKFDFIFSAFDSINYLNTDDKLNHFFFSIIENLSVNGLLTFDVSLMNNSIKHVKSLNRKGKYKGIEFEQKSILDIKKKLHKNHLSIKLSDGTVYSEEHIQKIYDFYYYFEVINSAGLTVMECFDAFTFNDASEESDRVQFIVRRR